MKAILLSVAPSILVFAALVTAQEGCLYSGVCVERKYCRDSTVGRKAPQPCRMQSKAAGVCCGVSNVTLAKNCAITYKANTYAGKCVYESTCYPFPQGAPKQQEVWRKWTGECSEAGSQQNLYCCPESLLLDLNFKELPPVIVERNKTANLDDVNREEFAKAQLLAQNVFPTCQTTPDKQDGHNVPLRQCDQLYDLFRKGLHQDHKSFANLSANISDSTPICCPRPANLFSLILHEKAVKLGLDKCGPIPMGDKVLSGDRAGLGQYPWMANLMYKLNKTHLGTNCSGSLIHPRYVLTAAHCIQKQHVPVAVRLGEYDFSKEIDCEEGDCADSFKEYEIANFTTHYNYRLGKRDHDIALIKLKTEVSLVPGQIFPICLPLTGSLLMLRPKQLTLTGWGQSKDGVPSDVMLKADLVNTEDNFTECKEASTFCARRVEVQGHCRGESGSPLQAIASFNNTYRTVLFGIAVKGPKECAVKDVTPVISIMVGYHMHWILDTMDV